MYRDNQTIFRHQGMYLWLSFYFHCFDLCVHLQGGSAAKKPKPESNGEAAAAAVADEDDDDEEEEEESE